MIIQFIRISIALYEDTKDSKINSLNDTEKISHVMQPRKEPRKILLKI